MSIAKIINTTAGEAFKFVNNGEKKLANSVDGQSTTAIKKAWKSTE